MWQKKTKEQPAPAVTEAPAILGPDPRGTMDSKEEDFRIPMDDETPLYSLMDIPTASEKHVFSGDKEVGFNDLMVNMANETHSIWESMGKAFDSIETKLDQIIKLAKG